MPAAGGGPEPATRAGEERPLSRPRSQRGPAGGRPASRTRAADDPIFAVDDEPGEAGRSLSLYLREIATAPLLRAEEELAHGRAVQRHTERFRRELAAVPFTAEATLERWRRLIRQGRVTATLSAVAPAKRRRNASARMDAAMRRLEREVGRLRGRRTGGPRVPRGSGSTPQEEAVARALLRAKLSLSVFEAAERRLAERLDELERAHAAGSRSRVRAIEREVGLPKTAFRRRMAAAREARAARGEAIHAFARHNQRLVVHVAKPFRGLGLAFPDLIQEGNLGLLRAAESFDPGRKHKFSTYAVWWIRQSLIRAIQNHSRTVRLPSHTSDQLSRYRRVTAELSRKLGRRATPAELGERLGLSPAEVEALGLLDQKPVSLDQTPDAGEGRPLHDALPDPAVRRPEEGIDRARLPSHIGDMLSRLDERESHVIREHFGLGAERAHTLQEIGRRHGISRERTRQIEQGALRKLRAWARDRELQALMEEGAE